MDAILEKPSYNGSTYNRYIRIFMQFSGGTTTQGSIHKYCNWWIGIKLKQAEESFQADWWKENEWRRMTIRNVFLQDTSISRFHTRGSKLSAKSGKEVDDV